MRWLGSATAGSGSPVSRAAIDSNRLIQFGGLCARPARPQADEDASEQKDNIQKAHQREWRRAPKLIKNDLGIQTPLALVVVLQPLHFLTALNV